MESKNVFDAIMDYIDDSVKLSYEEISRGIYEISGYTDLDFGKFLSILSAGKIGLHNYFLKRRMYFISKELVDDPSKSIADIAQEYGYLEQSSLSRAVKQCYGITPGKIRKEKLEMKNEKLQLSDFIKDNYENNNRLCIALKNEIGDTCNNDFGYFESFIHAIDEYGFDTATCCAISEISERIEVPFSILLNTCFDTMIDVHSQNDYISPRIEKAIDCGISSEEELEKICEYYNCKYYELSETMVKEYRKHNDNF